MIWNNKVTITFAEESEVKHHSVVSILARRPQNITLSCQEKELILKTWEYIDKMHIYSLQIPFIHLHHIYRPHIQPILYVY